MADIFILTVSNRRSIIPTILLHELRQNRVHSRNRKIRGCHVQFTRQHSAQAISSLSITCKEILVLDPIRTPIQSTHSSICHWRFVLHLIEVNDRTITRSPLMIIFDEIHLYRFGRILDLWITTSFWNRWWIDLLFILYSILMPLWCGNNS